jgi:membrane-bound lytic murein transglycosylase MltF
MDIVSLIVAAAVVHGVDPNLLKAVCFKESKHKNVNTNDGGSVSYGPCQAKRIAAKQVGMGKVDLTDMRQSINVAAMYLKHKIQTCSNTLKAIGAYNTGKCIIPKSGYVQSVTTIYKGYEDEED